MITVLTAWLCTFRLDFDSVAATRHAATLDTGLVANGYPGGGHTHLFSNHFQYLRATLCSLLFRDGSDTYPILNCIVAVRGTNGLETIHLLL